MRRALLLVAGSLIAYVGASSLLHFVVLPEPQPPSDDRPRSGTEIRLPGGSTFIYRLTAVESDGQLFEADWHGAPGAGVPRHTHPSQEVRLRIEEGSLRVVADGEERVLGPGEEMAIPAGVEHRWENPSQAGARGVFQLRPAGMADFVFVQLDRAFGGQAGGLSTAIQTFILIGTHGQHTAWPIRTLRFLIAPTARLFGYRSYYERAASSEPSSALGNLRGHSS
jgi:quercetin dioxygenase-like cupin family protein